MSRDLLFCLELIVSIAVLHVSAVPYVLKVSHEPDRLERYEQKPDRKISAQAKGAKRKKTFF